jgi:hypothetical protein
MTEFSTGPVDKSLDPNTLSGHPHGMSLIDGCPGCVLNTEPPVAASESASGWTCDYVCTDCGHAWTTEWRN